MIIVGCDFHPKWQQVAVLDAETGEIGEHKLMNGDGQAEQFYRSLPAPALVGIEACGNSQWFIDMLERLGHEVWIGDAAQIRASAACPEPAEGYASRRPTGAMRATFCAC
jgi:transposase